MKREKDVCQLRPRVLSSGLLEVAFGSWPPALPGVEQCGFFANTLLPKLVMQTSAPSLAAIGWPCGCVQAFLFAERGDFFASCRGSRPAWRPRGDRRHRLRLVGQ